MLGKFAPKRAFTKKDPKKYNVYITEAYQSKPEPENDTIHIQPKENHFKGQDEGDLKYCWGEEKTLYSDKCKQTLSNEKFNRKFDTPEKVMDWFILCRWGNKVTCPVCDSENIGIVKKTNKYGQFRCNNKACKQSEFNVFYDTPMMHAKLRARKVLEAFNEVMLAKTINFRKRDQTAH